MNATKWNNLMETTGFADGDTQEEFEQMKANKKAFKATTGCGINECSASTYLNGREFSTLTLTLDTEDASIEKFEDYTGVTVTVLRQYTDTRFNVEVS